MYFFLILGTVKFIDYEYADFNYQAYDIGNHFNEFAGTDNNNNNNKDKEAYEFLSCLTHK